MELFGRIPEEGATETSGMFTVTILESDEQSVSKVGIKLVLRHKLNVRFRKENNTFRNVVLSGPATHVFDGIFIFAK